MIGLIGLLTSAVVIWSYLQALGADRDVDHARAMALTLLLVSSAAITTGLSKLRQASARALVVGTLGSLVLLVQWPALSHWLSLRPLHAGDWAMAALVFAGITMASAGLAAHLRLRPG